MNNFLQNNFSFKNIPQRSSYKNKTYENDNYHLSPVKNTQKMRSQDKIKKSQYSSNKYRSQRQFKPQILQTNSVRKLSHDNHKVYKSYSQTKDINLKRQKNKQFIIRIPNDENLIQNYIEQLKRIKRIINQEKHSQSLFDKQKQNIISKVQQQKMKQNETVKQDKNYQTKLVKYGSRQQKTNQEQRIHNSTPQHKIFLRDKKKHLTKLKLVKQFIEENQIQQEKYSNQSKSQQKNNFTQQNVKTNKHVPNRAQFQHQYPYTNKVMPKKIIYGDVINLKQNFKITSPFQAKKFQRYSSQSGRKLYSISKSTDLRQKHKNRQRSNTEHKIKPIPYSVSMILRRKRTQSVDQNLQKIAKKQSTIPKKIFASIIKQKQNQSLIRIQRSNLKQSYEKFKSQIQSSSPQKTKPSNLNKQNNFKSIQGFSTIQDKKQTLDILGQSCKQIKINLIESNKKIDHILDLLGYENQQLKFGFQQKIKRRKKSYQRFNKIFPKGFFQ